MIDLTLNEYDRLYTSQKLYSVYPELKTETESYREVLGAADKRARINNVTFSIPITTGTKDESYSLEWNISDLKSYILKNNLNPIPVNIPESKEAIWSDPKELNMGKILSFKSNEEIREPIILAQHPTLLLWIVIDGNHRFHFAKQRGDDTINAIMLYPKIHVNFLQSELMRTMFIVMHNLAVINNFALYPKLRKCKVSDDFDLESVYPLLNKKYKFSKWRRFRYANKLY